MMNEEKQARRCGDSGAPKRCPYACKDVDIVPCRALVAVFGACFALMALWEVITSWM